MKSTLLFVFFVFVLPILLTLFAFYYRTKQAKHKVKEAAAVKEKGGVQVVDVLFVVVVILFIWLGVTNFYAAEEKEYIGGMDDDHETMDMVAMPMAGVENMEGMEGMVDINTLPLEEPLRALEPKIVQEDGKTIKEFYVWIEAVKKEIRPGVFVEAWGFNRQVPGPELRVQEGDHVRVIFANNHSFNHTIHWHGQHVPNEMDGVPGVTQYEVQPNETYTYEFVAGPSGTHIYHCHVDTDHHVDMGMYGAFIVEDKEEDVSKYDQEVTWVLSSFNTQRHPHQAEEPSKYFSGHQQYKVDKDAFLINGKAFPATTPLHVKEDDLVKMRMINIGKEPYALHIHGHSFTVTHKDGFQVANPQEMDTLPILPGERYDLVIKMKNKGAWAFHDHVTQHVTNDGFYPGGMMSLILYDDFTFPPYLQEYLARIAAYTQEARRLGEAPETATGGYGEEMQH